MIPMHPLLFYSVPLARDWLRWEKINSERLITKGWNEVKTPQTVKTSNAA